MFCLEGELEVSLRDPRETIRLAPGGRKHIASQRVHRVVNVTDRPLRYLLVQATGAFDFVAVDDEPPAANPRGSRSAP